MQKLNIIASVCFYHLCYQTHSDTLSDTFRHIIRHIILTHFWPMFLLYTPWNHQKTFSVFTENKIRTLARNRLNVFAIQKRYWNLIKKIMLRIKLWFIALKKWWKSWALCRQNIKTCMMALHIASCIQTKSLVVQGTQLRYRVWKNGFKVSRP